MAVFLRFFVEMDIRSTHQYVMIQISKVMEGRKCLTEFYW